VTQEVPVEAVMVQADAWAVGAFVGFLILLVGIGAYSVRFSSRGIGHFFVGGRKMSRLVVALSAVVSGRSAWLLLGVTGMAWSMGVSAVWAVVGYTAAEFLLFFWFAPRLRRFSEVHDCVTVTDFFAERFEDRKGWLRLLIASVLVVFMTAYVSAQFVGGGKAIGASFGLEPTTGVLLTALIVLAYTMVGGFLAVSLTDTIQAFFMIGALVGLPILAVVEAGGWAVVAAELSVWAPGHLDLLALGGGALLGMVGIGLGSPGNPHILVRYMSIDDAEQLRWAAWTGTAANVVMGAGAVFLGLVGRVHVPELSMLPAGDTENLYPHLAQGLLHPFLFGMVVASIFAAIMSTADSQLLVGASALVRDVYEKVLRGGEELSQRRLVVLSRAAVAAGVLVAVLLGWAAEELVFWLVLFAWAGLGAALGPTAILALYWRGTTWAGVAAGIVTGAGTAIVWYLTPALKGLMYELIPAFFLAALATVVVSRITSPPASTDEAFRVMGTPVRGAPLLPPPPPSPEPGGSRPPPGGPPRPGQ
jgi:sodium/proline symporter